MRFVGMATLLTVLGSAVTSCRSGLKETSAPAAKLTSAGDGQEKSNITRRDYAGSAACAACHSKEYSAWRDSPMHRMTRDVQRTTIRAPFAGNTFSFRDDQLLMTETGAARFMHQRSPNGRESLFRVSKVIGGRYREDFVGFEVDPNAPFGPAQGAERILPVSYLVFNGEWRYKGYSVMVRERPSLEAGVVWKTGCIFCHNTAPQLSLLLDDLYGAKAPSYQGSASVDLPDDKRLRYVVTDEPRLKAALSAELHSLGRPASVEPYDLKRALTVSIDGTRAGFDEQHLVELGIGCEACHGGAREHARDPTAVRPTFALRSDFLRVKSASGRDLTPAEDINRACAKCHTVLFSRYPYTWEGSARRHDPGGSSVNSGEARDFALGHCTSELSCVRCHDPHAEDSKAALQALEGRAGDELCESCHQAMRGPEARSAHTHHAVDGAGSHCLNCHLVKKNLGLAYELTRYHRIGSPTDRERVLGDRPLECAVCHTDKSVDQLVSTMERFWGKKYDRKALAALYGADLRVNAIEATLRYGKPHEQGTALSIAGREHRSEWLPLVVSQLGNDYPLIRYFARQAAEQITGQPLPVDMNAKGADIVASAQLYLAKHPRTPE